MAVMACLGDETIGAFVDCALDLAAIAQVHQHIDACATCRAQLSAMASAPVLHSFVADNQASAATVDVSFALAEARAGDPVPSFTIGRYVVESVIGRGAMGVVVRARDPELDRSIAIKLVDPAVRRAPGSVFESGGWRTRLRAEARAMAKLRHPNVVTVYDVGTLGDQVFVAMELVDGVSLAERLVQDRRGVIGLLIGAGRGLSAAHVSGLVHGDIKPDNILVDRDGRALIGDFGLAHAVADRAATEDGQRPLIGTPFYMAPELLRHGAPNALSDQFAFAVTVYEAVAGKRPWYADSIESLLATVERDVPTRPGAMVEAVWRVVERGLAVDPAARFRSMADLVADLERATRMAAGDGEQVTAEAHAFSSPLESTHEPTLITKLDGGFVTLVPGTLVGEYEIDKFLGAGAMAQVYGAHHERLRKRVAIKVIAQRLCTDRILVQRFEQEARLLAQLNHPNIVDVITFGHMRDGRSYLVMDWLVGESLHARLERGRMSLDEALDVIDQIVKGLAAAHDRGVIHRDLKPANCWLQQVDYEPQPVVKLLDFGLAKLAAASDWDTEDTATGVVFGTARYMSPEQAASSRDVDAATDVYALGCTAYEILTGQAPFPQTNVYELLSAHRSDAPPNASSIASSVPTEIDRLLVAMLDKDATARPTLMDIRATIAEVRGAMRSVPGQPAASMVTSSAPRRRAISLAIAAVVVIGLSIGGVVLVSRSSRDDAAAPMIPPPVSTKVTVAAVDASPPAPDAAESVAEPSAEPAPIADVKPKTPAKRDRKARPVTVTKVAPKADEPPAEPPPPPASVDDRNSVVNPFTKKHPP